MAGGGGRSRGAIISTRPLPEPEASATIVSSQGKRDDDDDDPTAYGEVDDDPYAAAKALAPPGTLWGDSGRRPGDRLRAKVRAAAH